MKEENFDYLFGQKIKWRDKQQYKYGIVKKILSGARVLIIKEKCYIDEDPEIILHVSQVKDLTFNKPSIPVEKIIFKLLKR